MIERRRFERIPFHCRASVAIPGERPVEAWTVDLSLGGVRLAAGRLFRERQLLLITFHLRDEAQREASESVHGVVVFSRPDSEGYTCGIEFLEPLKEATAPVLIRKMDRL